MGGSAVGQNPVFAGCIGAKCGSDIVSCNSHFGMRAYLLFCDLPLRGISGYTGMAGPAT